VYWHMCNFELQVFLTALMYDKKLSYCRWTLQTCVSVEISLATAKMDEKMSFEEACTFNGVHTTFYSTLVEPKCLSCTSFYDIVN